MTNTSFLDKIAKVLIEDYSEKLSNTIVVLPNKRAKIFLVEALKKQVRHMSETKDALESNLKEKDKECAHLKVFYSIYNNIYFIHVLFIVL